MYTRLKLIAKRLTGKHIQVVTAALISSYTYAAMKYSHVTPFEAIEWCKTRKFPNKARCSVSNNDISNVNADLQKPPKNELRIIILGTAGSGKSSVGNVLMKNFPDKHLNASWSAKPETTESKLKTIEFNNFKIDIIDTPGTKDSGLTDQAIEIEIQKAIALSSPGPHAFMLCIPAKDITDDHIDAIKPYEKYFGEEFYNYVILAFTRNDENEKCRKKNPAYSHKFECEVKHATAQNSRLKKIKNITNKQICISLTNSKNNVNTTELEKVIDIIEKIKEDCRKSKNKEFASCDFSEEAEKVLRQNLREREKENKSSTNISRETVKTSKTYLEHFSRPFCNYCQFFTQ